MWRGGTRADEQHHNDHDIGTAVIDSYTHYILEYLETLGKTSKATLQDFVSTLHIPPDTTLHHLCKWGPLDHSSAEPDD